MTTMRDARPGEDSGRTGKRENFIPFTKRDLVGHLAGKIGEAAERERFLSLCGVVETAYQLEFHRDLEGLKSAYAPLDPDRVTKSIPGLPDTPSSGKALLEELGKVLIAANYREVTRERVLEAFGSASPWGLQLKVDLDVYELLSLYYRGEDPESTVKRTLFLKRKFDYHVFRHVVLVFKMREGYRPEKGSDHTGQGKYRNDKVYLKLFKSVPTVDLEMLFPDTEIQVRTIDKLKVILPLVIGAASSLYKIAGYVLGHEDVQRLWTQIGFWTLVGGLFGIALKGFFSYRNTIEKYLRSLTESLYFQNLDNNSGVFKYLLDEAEEEECKEAILGYYFINYEYPSGVAEAALDSRIEAYFRDELRADLDFEVDDSIRKLRKLGILEDHEGKLRVLSPAAASGKIKEALRLS